MKLSPPHSETFKMADPESLASQVAGTLVSMWRGWRPAAELAHRENCTQIRLKPLAHTYTLDGGRAGNRDAEISVAEAPGTAIARRVAFV